jgi:hypothetical protein
MLRVQWDYCFNMLWCFSPHTSFVRLAINLLINPIIFISYSQSIVSNHVWHTSCSYIGQTVIQTMFIHELVRPQPICPRRPTMRSLTHATEVRTQWMEAITKLRCVHALTGMAPGHKKCANGFDCSRCPFDQMLDDVNTARSSISN